MDLTCVPKATIHEHGDLLAGESDINANADIMKLNRIIAPISITTLME
jgi:hypothetical protein